ncbi:uncharacterized protein LOC121747688 isoform X2 [Salvia splendens]|uniref:uncharacterized protein LOC121747688 isoform X2 n=1 Tax=Salvia splendens TaxID=180675 RepID=UPI001C266325|nr:uncharacterized protein LOC121747688 isoform X2 [Salvia splendens]
MAEGLDLTSRAVEEGGKDDGESNSEGLAERPVVEVVGGQTIEEGTESTTPQTEVGKSDVHIEEEETVARTEVPGPVAPPVIKPKAVKRKLVLKGDPRAEQPKPKRVSQRCLGKWASSKAKVNTTADLVEILSEEEGTTPTKLGEGSLPATDLEDTAVATETVSQTPSDQGEETTQMAEGPDLASAPAGHVEPRIEGTCISNETRPSAPDQPSTHAEKEPEDE